MLSAWCEADVWSRRSRPLYCLPLTGLCVVRELEGPSRGGQHPDPQPRPLPKLGLAKALPEAGRRRDKRSPGALVVGTKGSAAQTEQRVTTARGAHSRCLRVPAPRFWSAARGPRGFPVAVPRRLLCSVGPPV